MMGAEEGEAVCEIVQQEIPLISGVPLEKQLARVRVRHDALVANRPAVAEHLRKMDAEIAELAKVLEERRDLSPTECRYITAGTPQPAASGQ